MIERRTAVLTICYPEATFEDQLQLDAERPYQTQLTIDDSPEPALEFRSPIGAHRWSQVERQLARATSRVPEGSREFNEVRKVGNVLFQGVLEISRALRRFLTASSGPRRLVIASDRAEIHALPWEAMVDRAEGWRLLAQDDVSIVRSWGGFVRASVRVAGTVEIFAVTGPRTRGDAQQMLVNLVPQHTRIKPLTRDPETKKIDLEASPESIVSIEAHGDQETTAIELDNGWGSKAEDLASQLGRRSMVLLWSCFSGRPTSEGRPAAAFFNETADVVLAHRTPLHQDSCAEIATRFFKAILRSDGATDPETAVVKERAHLYTQGGGKTCCDWAALVLWMRQPVDLSDAVLPGPRLPAGAFVETSGSQNLKKLKDAIDLALHQGRPVLEAREVPRPIPLHTFDDVRGAVIYASGASSFEADGEVLEHIGGRRRANREHDPDLPSSAHPGDGLLTCLEFMARHRQSVLIWADTGPSERELLTDLIEVPREVAVVFVDGEAAESHGAGTRYVGLSRAGRYKEAEEDWRACRDSAGHDPDYWREGYWILVRLKERGDDAPECFRELRDLGRVFDSLLLEANFEQRSSRRSEARRLYEEARSLAAGSPCDLGRVAQELAYFAFEDGNFAEAERWYREAIESLEADPPEGEGGRELWADALGRALRDYAELLVNWNPPRCDEAKPKLRRALAIHGLDRRDNQVVTCLETRGRLEAIEGDHVASEADLLRAADLLQKSGNLAGWIRVTRGMACLASERGDHRKAGAILAGLFDRIRNAAAGPDQNVDAGRIAFDRARVAWGAGDLTAARDWAEKALSLLKTESKEHNEAEHLRNQAAALIPNPEE